ncbi:hypothetical protein EGW08_019512 [Elysia chlorotica]|uniref:Ig-like domain-containing protein n=1 Tax=Elysia chlorotica TaxID=188477 RepID=A0A433STW6_ELYCH|nr:hypothetical protein EGW08_019512 [Elysia chlorotica]
MDFAKMKRSKDVILLVVAELFAVLLFADCVEMNKDDTKRPVFDATIANVTVREGEIAILPCRVNDLGDHKVVWSREIPYVLLTHMERRIIDDDRMSVERPITPAWNLHIRETVYNDSGRYLCTVNTDIIMNKNVVLNVIVPPKIIINSSMENAEVIEGGSANLFCNAVGKPAPKVEWERLTTSEKGEQTHSKLCSKTNKVGSDGEVLIIHNITRYCGDTYRCVATNNRGDSTSKDIKVHVLFPPEVTVPSVRLGQEIGKETVLDCNVTASDPLRKAVWMKDGKEVKTSMRSEDKIRIDLYKESKYTRILSLRLMMIRKEHFGVYTCVGANSLGEAAANMTLYDYSLRRMHQMPAITSTTTAAAPRIDAYPSYMYPPRRQHHHSDRESSHYENRDRDRHHIVKDEHLRYKTGQPNYDHVSSNEGESRTRDSSGRDGGSRNGMTMGYLAVQVTSVWLISLGLRVSFPLS